MSYWKTLGISLDQFGMALCGGDEDCTISATTGYFYLEDRSFFWAMLQWIIDKTFYPVDGKGHCLKAYRKDPIEEYKEGNKVALFLLTTFFCIPIALILWTRHLMTG